VVALALAAAALALSSPAFQQGRSIPARYTCAGADRSPPLRWAHLPQTARSLALRVDDPNAPGGTFTHWTIWNLPATTTSLAAGVKWSFQGRNSFGRIGYGGPCPPAGRTHHYVFWLYALDARLTLRRGATRAQFGRAIRGHIVATANLVGLYRR
jgi:Raf kinase inhibitor-like YbhB/YbcL family protein